VSSLGDSSFLNVHVDAESDEKLDSLGVYAL
jgi:hypothetical protein